MHARRGVIAAGALICICACGSSGDRASKGSTGTAVPAALPARAIPAAKATAAPAAPEPSPPAQPPKPLAERAALESLLEHWVDVQNKGLFDAYSAMYAAKFQGVKRVGARAYRMQRAAWLADRARMFKRPMTVRALDSRFEIRSRLATIRFEQQWSSATFEDVGTKELSIVEENGALKIAREELLASRVLRSKAQLRALAGFAFVTDVGGPWAIVGKLEDPPAVHDPLVKVDVEDGFAVVAGLGGGSLPPELPAQPGRRVRVGTTSGAQCLGTLKQPSYVARVVPHFGEVEEWQGGFDGTGRKWTQGEVAEAVWELARGTPVGMRVELDPGDCPGTPLFVRDESAPAARIAQPVAEVPRKEEVTAAFHALPAYTEIQREYVRNFAEHGEGAGDAVPGAWDKDLLNFEAFRMPGATSTLVSLRSPGDPCGNWSLPKAWVVFDVPDDGASAITVHKPLTQQWSNEVELVLDLEADGKLEYLVRDDLGLGISLVTSGDEALVSWEIDYFDCPC